MIQRALIRFLLIPFSLLYGLGVLIRNLFYKLGLLKEIEFSIPVISVGNLTIGGTGKTPHIEYLVRFLKEYIPVATLSRGYRRKTKGFRIVNPNDSAITVGDEPLQFKRKFPDVFVTVSESRTFGIPLIIQKKQETRLILLDDAFQHLSVKPSLNILLTEYEKPFTRDFLLPTGRLREWKSAYKRADVIIVSKCPEELNDEQKDNITREMKLLPHQSVFFSFYRYWSPYYFLNPSYRIQLNESTNVLLMCAIAGTDYLLKYLEPNVDSIKIMQFEDHHYYTNFDLGQLKRAFDNMGQEQKIILTTEKDAMRLEMHKEYIMENNLPVFVLPISVDFNFNAEADFNALIKQHLLDFKA